MKKRFLSLALALVMCLGLCVPAMAAEEEANCQILKAGETTFTVAGITFTLSNPVIGQVAAEEATAPQTGKIVNVVASETVISCTSVPDDIEERIEKLVVEYFGIDQGTNAKTWIDADEGDFIDGGILGTDLYVFSTLDDNGELPVYLKADSEAIAAAEAPAETPAEAPAEEAPAEAPAAPKFTDVAATSPFAAAIDWAVEQGITKGTTPTTFGPSNTCTVRQILTFLYRANSGNPDATLDASVAWAVEQGMIEEDDDTTAPCTRMKAVTFIWQAAGEPVEEKEAFFEDAAMDVAINWAVAQGVTQGTGDGTTFSPDNTCTRGQIATFLYRAAQ